MEDEWLTKQTLIQRIREADSEDKSAWDDFVSYYQTFIDMLLAKWNFPKSERDDLIQEVLLRIWKGIPKYEYREGEVKFRTWLSRLIKNAMLNYLDKLKRKNKPTVELEGLSLSSDDDSDLEKIIENEWTSHIISLAMKPVMEAFSGQAAEVFKLSTEGVNSKEIADKLQITERTVYTLRSRFKVKLQKEIQALRDHLEGR